MQSKGKVGIPYLFIEIGALFLFFFIFCKFNFHYFGYFFFLLNPQLLFNKFLRIKFS